MEPPDWNLVFRSPVLDYEEVGGGYANAVWRVQTAEGGYIVKIAHNAHAPERPFWDGMERLFGLNIHENIRYRGQLADFIREHTPLMVPKIYHAKDGDAQIEQPYQIVEQCAGEPLTFESGPQREQLARQLGRYVGSLHWASFSDWGCYPEPRYAASTWGSRLAVTMTYLAQRWFQDDDQVRQHLPRFVDRANALPPPRDFALILPDFRMNQFLEQDNRLHALVDIESQVLGPRGLDFIALEYSLPAHLTPLFLDGYRQYLQPPALATVRPLYRFLYYLMQALGEFEFEEWMQAPVQFDDEKKGANDDGK